MIDCIPDAQALLMVSAETVFGISALIAACRAGVCPRPAESMLPMIEYSISSRSKPERSTAALMAVAPSSVAGVPASAPWNLPRGVLAAPVMNTLDLSALTIWVFPVSSDS